MRISYAEINGGTRLGQHDGREYYRAISARKGHRTYVRMTRHPRQSGFAVDPTYEALMLPNEDANTDTTIQRHHLDPLWVRFEPLLTWYTLYLKATSPEGELTYRAVTTPDSVVYYCSPNKLVNVECDASPYRVSHRSRKYAWRHWWFGDEGGSSSSITDMYDFGTIFDEKDQPRVGAVLWDLEKSKVTIASVSPRIRLCKADYTPKTWK